MKTVAYNDFIDLLPGLKVKPETHGDVIPGTGDRKTSATHNSTIESFDLWDRTLPDFNSSFKTDTWTDCSSRYRDQTLANDLLHDIRFGVNIGFSGNHDSQIYENHFLAKTNPEAVAKELERELTLNRKIGPFLTSDRQLKSTQYLRNVASFAIYPGPSLTLLTMVFPKNCFVVPTTPLTR